MVRALVVVLAQARLVLCPIEHLKAVKLIGDAVQHLSQLGGINILRRG